MTSIHALFADGLSLTLIFYSPGTGRFAGESIWFVSAFQDTLFLVFIMECSVDSMTIDPEPSTKISTHGPRNSRREEWRKSKGLPARASSRGMNRQGMVAGKRKAGRSKRRR